MFRAGKPTTHCFGRQPSMQCFTTIQGLFLVNVNIILLLMMENSKVEIFYLENNLQHLIFVSKACCTFTPKLFPYRWRIKHVGAPWGSCVGQVHHSFPRPCGTTWGQTGSQPLKSLQSLHEFKYSSKLSSSSTSRSPNSFSMEIQILETWQRRMIPVTTFSFARLCASLGSDSGFIKRATAFR